MAHSYNELEIYQLSIEFQQNIFVRSKHWPKEELYALTDQIRRSSRSIGACIAEAWGKRRYPAHFLSKLTDADSENLETQHWITTAKHCGYLTLDETSQYLATSSRIGRQLGTMMAKHESFCIN